MTTTPTSLGAPRLDTDEPVASIPGQAQPAAHDHRWLALAVLGLAQLMVVLDATIVNIALPSAQRALAFSNADRQWVVTAYALTFGGLLLLGGRLADLVGRRRMFLIGLAGFALSSAAGGASTSFGMLVAARAAQGAFGAMLAPAALSLLTTLFTDVRDRARAFAIYGAIAGAGAAVGLLLGGVLTEYLDWRWCLFVNIAFALVAAAGALAWLRNQERVPGARLDLRGALVAVAGLASLVYGFSEASIDGWSSPVTIGFL
ncbi:MAG TPA: MFS transporter, partial [Acidimicrobiales bacterium]|nr:MFS transporter [Acidimicrobiales bacterium]